MAARVHTTMDKLCGIQQGLEASMMNHKQELLHKFGEKLEHACQQAEDSAFHRAKEYLVPALEVLGEQLNALRKASSLHAEDVRHAVSDLSTRLEGACRDIASLQSHAESTATGLGELSTQLSTESHCRDVHCQQLSTQILDLQAAAAAESQQRDLAESNVHKKLQDASKEARAATRDSTERADEQFRQMQEKVKALEARFAQDLQQQLAQSLQEANQQLEDLAGQFRLQLQETVAHAEHKVALSNVQTEALVKASAAELRREQVDASEGVLERARRRMEERAEALSGRLEDGLHQAAQHTEKKHAEGKSDLCNAVAGLEAKLADACRGIDTAMQSLQEAVSRGDSSRILLRRTLQAESAQSKSATAELSKASAHAIGKLETRLQGEVTQLNATVADLRSRLSHEAERLHTEVTERPTRGEVSQANAAVTEHFGRIADALDSHGQRSRLAEAGLAGRCGDVHREVGEVQFRSQQEMAVLGQELTMLRSATTSLTNGMVRALQVIGLWESVPGPASGPAQAKEDTAPRTDAGPTPRGAETPRPPSQPRRVELEDLLQWERAGDSMASRVARSWQRREPAGAPTMLAALERRLDVEDHAVARELIRSAGRPGGPAAPPAAPAAPAASAARAPPAAVSLLRQQRAGPPGVGS